MNIEGIKEELYAIAINDLLVKLKEYKRSYTAKRVAELAETTPFALSKARNITNSGGKFGGVYRKDLLKRIIDKTGNVFAETYDSENDKIVISRKIDHSETIPDKDIYIYKTYYWRGRPVGVGVGIMRITAKNERWDQATLIVNNKYPAFRDDEPYILSSYKIESLGKNTFIEFRDDSDLFYRQTGIFQTYKKELKKRKIVEGIFASITRKNGDPIAGIMLMEILDEEKKAAYLLAESQDILAENEHNGKGFFENRQEILNNMNDIPSIIYNTIYGERIQTTGKDIFEINVLPAYETVDYFKKYVGVYEGSFIRAKESKLEIFLLQFSDNGDAIIYFPGSSINEIRSKPVGKFKWVYKPKSLLTASFGYDPVEDHWRFRFIIDGEFKYGNYLYGVFAGTEFQSVEPVSGRVRLKRISQVNNLKSLLIDDHLHILKQLTISSEEYWKKIDQDINLREFLSGIINPTYTDTLYNLLLIEQENLSDIEIEAEPDLDEESFLLAGDYEVYSLYRKEEHDEYRYYILRQPLRINNDRSVNMRIRGGMVSGEAVFSMPVLKINLNAAHGSYTHILFTINQLHYDEIGHVYGVLTGVHVKKNRSEATAAVLVGPYVKRDEAKRELNFDNNNYKEYEVGSDEYFDLDSKRPSKIASFLSGHFNRYISPPGRPNVKMQTRISSYRLSFFKAACYSGTKYLLVQKKQEPHYVQSDYKITAEDYMSECLQSIKDAFQHGFCDPTYFRENIDDIHPKYDIDLLVNELLPGGCLKSLVEPILELCDNWRRTDVRKIYESRK